MWVGMVATWKEYYTAQGNPRLGNQPWDNINKCIKPGTTENNKKWHFSGCLSKRRAATQIYANKYVCSIKMRLVTHLPNEVVNTKMMATTIDSYTQVSSCTHSVTPNVSAFTAPIIWFAPLIKSCSTTGCHTSLTFTLAWFPLQSESLLSLFISSSKKKRGAGASPVRERSRVTSQDLYSKPV